MSWGEDENNDTCQGYIHYEIECVRDGSGELEGILHV